MTEEKLILEGILTGIYKVETVFQEKSSESVPIGFKGARSTTKIPTIRTTIVIENTEELRRIEFDGIILPDSLNHRLRVYGNDKIYDVVLDRSYTVRRE